MGCFVRKGRGSCCLKAPAARFGEKEKVWRRVSLCTSDVKKRHSGLMVCSERGGLRELCVSEGVAGVLWVTCRPRGHPEGARGGPGSFPL